MRLWQFVLIAVAMLSTFDYVANNADGIEAVWDWMVRNGRHAGGAIRTFVMAVFGR